MMDQEIKNLAAEIAALVKKNGPGVIANSVPPNRGELLVNHASTMQKAPGTEYTWNQVVLLVNLYVQANTKGLLCIWNPQLHAKVNKLRILLIERGEKGILTRAQVS